MTDEGDALRQMLANLGGSDAQDADLVLMQLERDAAHLLELCAIPHAFNEILLAVLAPEASQDLRTGFLAELQLLPAIIDNDGDFACTTLCVSRCFGAGWHRSAGKNSLLPPTGSPGISVPFRRSTPRTLRLTVRSACSIRSRPTPIRGLPPS
jgi:hypothetical protein